MAKNRCLSEKCLSDVQGLLKRALERIQTHPLFAWNYRVKSVERIIDGDTVDLLIDLGFNTFLLKRIRLIGVDCPEIHGVKKESEEFKAGLKAKEFVRSWFEEKIKQGYTLYVHTAKENKRGEYDRYAGLIFAVSDNAKSFSLLNLELLSQKICFAYNKDKTQKLLNL